jgi:TPR repeat protein
MKLDEFNAIVKELLETNNIQMLSILKQAEEHYEEPIMYLTMSQLYDPDSTHVWGKEISKGLKSKVLNESLYQKCLKQQFQLCKVKAESGNYDYMSYLADLYITGLGTEKNLDKAEYWLDKLYLKKEGMKHKEWLAQNEKI